MNECLKSEWTKTCSSPTLLNVMYKKKPRSLVNDAIVSWVTIPRHKLTTQVHAELSGWLLFVRYIVNYLPLKNQEKSDSFTVFTDTKQTSIFGCFFMQISVSALIALFYRDSKDGE